MNYFDLELFLKRILKMQQVLTNCHISLYQQSFQEISKFNLQYLMI